MAEPATGIFVTPAELAEVVALNTQLNGIYGELGWREAQRRELAQTMDTLSGQVGEVQRELNKSSNRIFTNYKTPPGTKLNFATGELITPEDPRYSDLK